MKTDNLLGTENCKLKIIPKKSLGQNFLINAGVLEKIANAAELNKNDTVLEVGPGTGNLTKLISERAGSVVAIEKDYRLIEGLKLKFPAIKLIEGDILKLDVEKLLENCKPRREMVGEPTEASALKIENCHYKVVGNIPYYITSHLLKKIFEEWPRPKLIILTVQKEVAKRIVAKPPDMNLLALSIQLYSEPKIIGYISKGSFRPIPKVDSAIIKLIPKEETDIKNNEKVIEMAKKAFAGKRKQLQNTLPDIDFISIGIDPKSRPEELSIYDWLRIVI